MKRSLSIRSRPAGVREPHDEHRELGRLAIELGAELAEVDLRFRTRRIGLGIAACQRCQRVPCTAAAAMVYELAEAADERQHSRLVARYGGLGLDELNDIHLDPHGAELLFQILTERAERVSVAVASNAPFSEWGQTFDDPRLAVAVVDRLTFRAHIIETGSDSYWLRLSQSENGGERRP